MLLKGVLMALFLVSLSAGASVRSIMRAGTGFSAPTVKDYDQVNLPQQGDIVYDSRGTFYGNRSDDPAIPDWVPMSPSSSSYTAPQMTVLTTAGSGSYSVPIGVLYLKVRMVGGGGGGAGSGSGAGSGGPGADTVFGSITATKGSGGAGTTAGSGGLPTGGNLNIAGGDGKPGAGTASGSGGDGGVSFFGGNGWSQLNMTGGTAKANTGSGGAGGGGVVSLTAGGAGGGAGGYAESLIVSPSGPYMYTVGTGGGNGSAGTGGNPGGSGAAGTIIVEAHYQ